METMHGQPSARLRMASSVLSSLLFMTIDHITLLLVRTSGQTGRNRTFCSFRADCIFAKRQLKPNNYVLLGTSEDWYAHRVKIRLHVSTQTV